MLYMEPKVGIGKNIEVTVGQNTVNSTLME